MTRRLLVLGAGTGASNNLIGSLRAGDPTLYIVGCHADRFVLKKSTADRNYLVLATEHWDFLASLRRVVLAEGIELVIPNSDADVRAVARRRGWCPSRLFLPRASVISRCQDKYVLSVFLRRHGVPAPRTWPIRRLSDVDRVFRHVGPRQRLWCRIRTGGGSRGAIPVVRAEQARSWIAYWRDMRGVATEAFTLSEYLPGRDFAAQGLWRDAELLLLDARPRQARCRSPRDGHLRGRASRPRPPGLRGLQRRSEGGCRRPALRDRDQRGTLLHDHAHLRSDRDPEHGPDLSAAGLRRAGDAGGRRPRPGLLPRA